MDMRLTVGEDERMNRRHFLELTGTSAAALALPALGAESRASLQGTMKEPKGSAAERTAMPLKDGWLFQRWLDEMCVAAEPEGRRKGPEA